MSIEQKDKATFSLTIISIKRYILNKDNNEDNMKTYIYKQTITLLQILSIERKDKIKLGLAIVIIERHI